MSCNTVWIKTPSLSLAPHYFPRSSTNYIKFSLILSFSRHCTGYGAFISVLEKKKMPLVEDSKYNPKKIYISSTFYLYQALLASSNRLTLC